MARAPVVLIAALLVSCGTVTPPTPTPGPSTSNSSTPTTRRPPPTSSARPTPTPGSTSPLDGTWASSRISHQQAGRTLGLNGYDLLTVKAAQSDASYLYYTIFELEIGDGRWTEYGIADGVPRGVGFAGTFTMPDQQTVIATPDGAECQIELEVNRGLSSLTFEVRDDTCGEDDLATQIVIYESSRFHIVVGRGAPAPVLTVAGPGPPPSPGASPVSTSADRLTVHPIGTVDGAPVGYAEYLPPTYEQTDANPLIVYLHDAGESGAGDSEALDKLTKAGLAGLIRFNKWPDDRPFVVLAPQYDAQPNRYCVTADTIAAFLAFAVSNYKVDPDRVYLVGHNCGAIGGWNYLGAHTDEVIAAAVMITGNGYGAIDEAGCNLARVAIWAFSAAGDTVVPARESSYPIGFLQTCTNPTPDDARLTLYPNDNHDAWTLTYNGLAGLDIYGWLLTHARGR